MYKLTIFIKTFFQFSANSVQYARHVSKYLFCNNYYVCSLKNLVNRWQHNGSYCRFLQLITQNVWNTFKAQNFMFYMSDNTNVMSRTDARLKFYTQDVPHRQYHERNAHISELGYGIYFWTFIWSYTKF